MISAQIHDCTDMFLEPTTARLHSSSPGHSYPCAVRQVFEHTNVRSHSIASFGVCNSSVSHNTVNSIIFNYILTSVGYYIIQCNGVQLVRVLSITCAQTRKPLFIQLQHHQTK